MNATEFVKSDAGADPLAPVIERLDALVEVFQQHPDPAVQAHAAALVEALRELHGEALRRLVALLQREGTAYERALADPVVSNVLFLHDLIAPDERAAAEAALDSVRPVAHAHGGEIELIDAAEGVVRLRLRGSCCGCPSSTATLRGGVESALRERLPGFARIELEEAPASDVVMFQGDTTACIVPAEKMTELAAQAARRGR